MSGDVANALPILMCASAPRPGFIESIMITLLAPIDVSASNHIESPMTIPRKLDNSRKEIDSVLADSSLVKPLSDRETVKTKITLAIEPFTTLRVKPEPFHAPSHKKKPMTIMAGERSEAKKGDDNRKKRRERR